MKKKKFPEPPKNKPFISQTRENPESENKKDEENIEASDPNYSFYPSVANPTGPETNNNNPNQ